MKRTLFAAASALACFALPSLAATSYPPGIDLSGMDRSVKPGDDFFAYANGAWAQREEIPPDRSSWGLGAELSEKTTAEVADLVKAAQGAKPGTEARKVGDAYAAFMATAAIEKQGLTPLRPTLARIAAIRDKKALAAEFGRELRADVDPINNTNFKTDHLFGLFVEADLHAPAQYAPYLLQGGLNLPDRDYYLADTPRMQKIRDAYRAHVEKMLTLMGHRDVSAEAARIIDLETRIARAHAPRAESEDVLKADNRWTRASFATRAPGLDWSAFFAAAGLAGRPSFYVWHPHAIPGEAALVGSEPLSVWKEYLAFHQVEHYAAYLPKAFDDERFAFYSGVLSGVPKPQDRWKRAVDVASAEIGQGVGKLYVAKYFPPSSKREVQTMVSDIIAAFDKRIDTLDWMAPATKVEAKKKLKTLKVGVGYPERWIDYTALKLSPTEALANKQRAELFEYRRNLAKFGHPVDRAEWAMNPQLVNAVNLPVKNALNFPAAELQAPHFNPASPAAVNLGEVGAIIGHEISHSFDDQGAQFDSQGRLRNWWTKADFAHFQASGKALADQFSAYKPFPDLNLRGEQELSENIADIAGLNAAYDAYRIRNGGKEGPSAQGFTGDQQFFIAFAQGWRTKYREAQLRQQVITDGHAPSPWRALTVRNMDAWYRAFDVKPGETLYLKPDERVKVW